MLRFPSRGLRSRTLVFSDILPTWQTVASGSSTDKASRLQLQFQFSSVFCGIILFPILTFKESPSIARSILAIRVYYGRRFQSHESFSS